MLSDASMVGMDVGGARRERLRREKARRHLTAFCEYMDPKWRTTRHQVLMADYLELVETYIRSGGKTGIGRLMIFMPPRHGKTELVSKKFPAWVLGRNPDKRGIMTSYGADLARDNSRAVRNMINDQRYAAVFGDLSAADDPVQLSSDSRSVDAWNLAQPHRGGMVAVGVGGPITGRGAHLLVVDDPVKNRQEAESAGRRQEVWDWWTSTAYTRLEDGGAVVLIQTRWHGDDLAGRLLSAMGYGEGEDWVVVSLPARALGGMAMSEEERREQLKEGVWVEADALGRAKGEALWPEKYGDADLERIEAAIGPYDFESLYQQQPFSKEGRKFQREWFVVEGNPKGEEIVDRVRYWDKAGTRGGGAYTCGVLMNRMANGLIWVDHVVRGQWETAEREAVILETARSDAQRPGSEVKIRHEREPGSSGLDSAKATTKMLAEAGFASEFNLPTGDKEVRAGPWASAGLAGLIRLTRGGWNEAYIDEHVSFPKGKYKDQVDASSGAYGVVGIMGMDGQLFF